MKNRADAGVGNSPRSGDRPSKRRRPLFDNFAAIGFEHRSHGDRGGVAAAPAQRGNFLIGHRIDPLESRRATPRVHVRVLSRTRTGRTSKMRAEEWDSSVMHYPGLTEPVTSTAERRNQKAPCFINDTLIRSPVVSNISSSRRLGCGLTWIGHINKFVGGLTPASLKRSPRHDENHFFRCLNNSPYFII